MHEGKLTRAQLQAWALNRYYYQSRIPIKDAIILSRAEDRDFRRVWRKRIIDLNADLAATNKPTGTPNTPVGILPHSVQTFLLVLKPDAANVPTDLTFGFYCSGADSAPIRIGLNMTPPHTISGEA